MDYTELINERRQRLTLPGFTLVPSARVDLTSLFGMGRGDPHRYSHLNVLVISGYRYSLPTEARGIGRSP